MAQTLWCDPYFPQLFYLIRNMGEAERCKHKKKTAPHGAASRKKFLNLRKELVNLGFPDVWILKCTVLR